MSQRYPLRNPSSGKSQVRRLSPTAVRNTGPLARPGVTSDNTGTSTRPRLAASHLSAAMPTDANVDATELEASAKVDPLADNEPESSLTGQDLDGHSTMSPSPPVLDEILHSKAPQDESTHGRGDEPQMSMSPDDRATHEKNKGATRTEIDPAVEHSRGDKGKGIDPSNWGNINLDDAEADRIQQEILNECNQHLEDNEATASNEITITREELLEYLKDRKKLNRLLDQQSKKRALSHKKGDRARSAPLSDELENLIRKVADGSSRKAKYKPGNPGHRNKISRATDPISQITAKSALGRAFERISNRDNSSSSPDNDSSTDNEDSSSESSSDDGYTSDSSSTSSPGSEDLDRRRKKGRKRGRSCRRTRTLIKPTPPEKYSGQADLRSFHKFLAHRTSYVKYGAYTFYTQRVSTNPEKWDLQRNCPDKSRGTYRGNKTPGLGASSVQFGPTRDIERTEQLQDGEEKLFLIETEEGPRQRLGQAAARKAKDLLESMQPYPGDPANVLEFKGRRFQAYRYITGELVIHDRVHDVLENISKRKVMAATYKIGEWYANLCHQRTGAPFDGQTVFQMCYIVDVISWNARKVLESGIPYVGEDKQQVQRFHRFDVINKDDTFEILDNHRESVTDRIKTPRKYSLQLGLMVPEENIGSESDQVQ
ncbi:hypothetical protein C0993_006224 [Termitomyces sp. T159_Od127]|nr:hypothetical protein C0993_006224 [Termitomyces sp. T159_Od127]